MTWRNVFNDYATLLIGVVLGLMIAGELAWWVPIVTALVVGFAAALIDDLIWGDS